jgi:aminoglycoside phosphotransferase (APT) family kinase protein
MMPETIMLEIVRAHVPDVSLAAITALKGGVSADVSRLDLQDKNGRSFSAVLRVHGPTHNGHNAALEFALLQSLTAAGLPVPGPIAFDDTRQVASHPFVVLHHIAGETAIAAQSVDTCIATAADLLVAIHATPTIGLPALPERLDPIPDILTFLPSGDKWAAIRSQIAALSHTIFTGAPALLHGDYWPGNWLWQGTQLTGVIDWEDAAIGDPLSDVACTCLELRYMYGTEGADCFLKAYGRHHAIDHDRLALWQIYVAAAGQHSMANWGLESSREAAMRAVALLTIEEAAERLFPALA